MAATRRTSSTKKTTTRKSTSVRQRVEKIQEPVQGTSLLDYFKFGESYTSLVLGIVVVIFATVLLLSFFKTRNTTPAPQQSTSSIQTVTEDKKSENAKQSDIKEDRIQGQRTYIVKSGDDLWGIAVKNYNDGFKWVEIAKANNLTNPGVINVGNKLTLPDVDASTSTSMDKEESSIDQPAPKAEITKEAATSDRSINGKTYVIQSGDDLWDIAVRAYGDGYRWVEIARVNNLADPNLIHSGNTLQLPR